ncbi:TPA: restriction endonuclease subunit S, partial [Haemophilus influenzae]
MAFNSLATDKNWQKYSLEEICLKITSGGTPSRQNPKLYKNGNINWIKTKELNNGYIFESEEKITEEAIKKSSAKLLPVNTILLAMYGATVGELGILGKEMACNQACCALIIDPKKADYRFIFYLLRLYKKEIQSLATGAAQQNLSAKTIKEFSFYIPNLEKQKKIADILSELDKKIDLNTQINQTLEQIAQALFKSWFVDFDPVRAKVQALSDGLSLEQAELAAMQAISGKTPEELTALSQTQPDRYAELAETAKAFPCEMVEVDGVEVPKGWELSTIGDCYDVVMGQSPKGETYNENKQGMLFYQGRAEFGWRFPTPRLFTTDPKRIAEQNSILMSVRAPVGDINIALEKCCIGRGLAALQHKSKNLSFGLYQIQSIKPELDLFNG